MTANRNLGRGLRIFPKLEKKVVQAPRLVSMGHILLLDSVVPKSKAILAAVTWITSGENFSKGQEG